MGKEYLLLRNLLYRYLRDALKETEKRREFFEFVQNFSVVLKAMMSMASFFPAEESDLDPSAGASEFLDVEVLFKDIKRRVVSSLRLDMVQAVEEFKFLKKGLDALLVVLLIDKFCSVPDAGLMESVQSFADTMTDLTMPKDKGGDGREKD